EQGASTPILKNRNQASSEESEGEVARNFQTHLELLLKQRNGNLSPEEESTLRSFSPQGNARYASRVVTKREPIVEIDLELVSAKELYLVVTDAGDGASCDHADWADAHFVTAAGRISLTDLKWRKADTTYGS